MRFEERSGEIRRNETMRKEIWRDIRFDEWEELEMRNYIKQEETKKKEKIRGEQTTRDLR